MITGEHGVLWSLIEGPLVFIATDYITYWHHRVYHMPFLYKVICERFTLLSHLSIELKCQHFHKLHHTYKQPTAFSVTAIHPVEFLNIQAVYISPMFTVPMYAREYTTKIF